MTFLIHFFIFFLNVELPEEVKSDDSINVYNDCQQHHSQDKLKLKKKHINNNYKNITMNCLNEEMELKYIYLLAIVGY